MKLSYNTMKRLQGREWRVMTRDPLPRYVHRLVRINGTARRIVIAASLRFAGEGEKEVSANWMSPPIFLHGDDGLNMLECSHSGTMHQ